MDYSAKVQGYETGASARTDSLTACLERIADLMLQVEKIDDHLSSLADRVDGGQPPKLAKAADTPPAPSATLFKAKSIEDSLKRHLERVGELTKRLDACL